QVSLSADTSSLFLDIKPVLAHSYPGIDTASLLARIQERQKWGEKNELLMEAEGIIHWDRGDVHLAVPCFKGLSHPGYLSMGFMAEALLAKGDRYEAAGWFLKSARGANQNDSLAISMYKRYLEIKPNDIQAEVQLAASLELQIRYAEAGAIYWKHQDLVIKNPQAALRIGPLLASQGRATDALALYTRCRELHPGDKSLSVRIAETRESLGQRLDAAQAWIQAWSLDAADSTARNRAIAHLEAIGIPGDAPLKELLEKALGYDPASASLNFKLAVLCLRSDDRKAAYAHLDRALKASPGNPTYLARLPEAIEGDSLIQANFPFLKAKYEKEGATLNLALLVARGFSLAGDKPKACHAWAQIAALAPAQLEGRRDAFLDLAACGDPASLALASGIGEKHLASGFNREASQAMVQIAMRSKDFKKASVHATRMVMESPADAPMALSAAKAMLDAGKNQEAKDVLAAIGKHAPMPEAAMLLGRMEYAEKDCAHAAEQFRIARDSFPEALRLRAGCLAELGNFEAAAAEYETHYARTGDKESLRAVARMYKELHYGPKEIEVLEALNAKGWASDEEKLRMGGLKAAQGDANQALAIYGDLFRTRATLPSGEGWSEAAIALGIQDAREGKLDVAIRVLSMGLKAAPAKTPGIAEAWIRLGECQAEKRQWRDAWSAYSSALAADSMSGEAAVEMLHMAKKLDSKKELTDAYRAVYRLDASNEEANAYLASVRQASREYKEAAGHYRRLTQLHPADAKAWENLGNALALIPDLAAARVPLQTAIDLGAQSDEVYINRARAYRMDGSKDMAASILEFLLNRNPHDYLAILWSAKFAEEDGNQHNALELFKKTTKLTAPRSPWPEMMSQGVLEAKVSVSAD
ncbi:MAG: Tetratricopeptide repeat-containing protein, partial [Fibrobacteres bacterium]|nr:Tetratricopeptide repeat-containing protein [Fibrobacterota bacterium]